MNKDNWRTPPELVDDALALLNINRFDVDVCCSSYDTKIFKANNFIAENENALRLLNCWFYGGGFSFCNPPFSRKWEFLEAAKTVVHRCNKSVLMVLPYTPVTKEWREKIDPLNGIVYVPDGRYQFLTEAGEKPTRIAKNGKKITTSPDFPVALVLVVPFFTDGAKYINYKRGIGNEI